MRVPPLVKLIPVLGLLLAAQTLSQSIDNFPQCWRECLRSSDLSCKDTDLNCICSSAPSHLSPLLTCVASKCPAASVSLYPLQVGCQLSSSPIPSSLLSSVESIVTDVAHPTILLASPTSLTVISTSTIAHSAVSATAAGKHDDGGGQGGGDGTVLDLEGRGGKKEGGCLLGLTVGILAGIAWF